MLRLAGVEVSAAITNKAIVVVATRRIVKMYAYTPLGLKVKCESITQPRVNLLTYTPPSYDYGHA